MWWKGNHVQSIKIQYRLKTLRPSYLLASSQDDRKVFDRICIFMEDHLKYQNSNSIEIPDKSLLLEKPNEMKPLLVGIPYKCLNIQHGNFESEFLSLVLIRSTRSVLKLNNTLSFIALILQCRLSMFCRNFWNFGSTVLFWHRMLFGDFPSCHKLKVT